MTRIDFYQLSDTSVQAPLMTACKLVSKALREHTKVFIQVPDNHCGEKLDELLWQFDPDAFVAHVLLPRDNASDAPVAIGVGMAPDDHADVLINLSDTMPPRFQRFERVLELVPAIEEQRINARTRYKYYQERGFALQYHKL